MPEVFTVLVGRTSDALLVYYEGGTYDINGHPADKRVAHAPSVVAAKLRSGIYAPAPPPIPNHPGPFNRVREGT